ncbi:MAG: LptF/LptG family permease, partial [Campylobacteraceae bacterium]
FLISAFLAVNVLVFMPLSKNLQSNFVQYKKAEAKFNVRATEFGQKFSGWMVFINNSDKDKYENIVMYTEDNNKDQIISANEAYIINENGSVRLELEKGKAYDITNASMHQVDFEKMILRSSITDEIRQVESVGTYWLDIFTNKKKSKDFIFYLLLALFPLATTMFALSFGIVTYRYQKGGIYFFISLVILTYFGITFGISGLSPLGIVAVFLAFFISSALYFKQKILKRY